MNNKMIAVALIAAGIAAAGGAGLYRAGVSAGMKSTADTTEKKPLYWHDPMVPGHKFDKPGKSPFMDMQLVPVYADGAGESGVTISPRVQQNLGMRTAPVTLGSMAARLSAVGSVAYNEREVALVQARSNGYVERLHVRAPLDPVKMGQPLLELYVPDWIAAQEEYLAARRMQGSGMAGLADAARQRMLLAGMNEAQVRLVEASGRTHPRITVSAPVGGVIAELTAREGMTVTTGAPLFRINGLATVWVNAEVPENAAAGMRAGTAVEARAPALPGMVFKGKVSALLPEVNPATRTIIARIELANPGAQLMPGMFATLTFAPPAGRQVLLVPSEAVIQTGTRSVVMLALGGGKFVPANVDAGAEANGQTEIRSGLEAGQMVVVSGQFLIDSEASLKGATAAPADAGGPLHRAQGKVESIARDEVMLSHGPVPTLQWDAMTMGFKPPPGGMPANVRVGDSVSFEFRQNQDGTFEITSIAPSRAPQ